MLAYLALAVAVCVLFVGGGSRFAIGLALKPIVDDMASGRGLVGLSVAVFQLVSAVCLVVAGRLADRARASLVLALGLAVSAAGCALMGVAREPWHIVVLYGIVFAVGNGLASLTPVGVMVSRSFPGRLGLANAVALTGSGLGQLVMMSTLAGVLDGIGWRTAFLLVGAAHLAVLPLVLLAARTEVGPATAARGPATPGAQPPGTAQARSVAQAPGVAQASAARSPTAAAPVMKAPAATGLSIREALGTSRLWLLLAVYALCGFEDFFVATHVVAFAQDRGADAVLAGRLLAAMGLMSLLGVLAAGLAADRIGPVWPTLLAFLVRVAIFAAVLLDQSTPTVAVFALLFGATFLVTAPLTVVFARWAFGTRHLGAITGLITMVHHAAGGLGALVGGLLFDAQGSYRATLWLMLATSLAGALLSLGLGRLRREALGAPSH